MSAAVAEPISTLPKANAPMAAAMDRFIMFRMFRIGLFSPFRSLTQQRAHSMPSTRRNYSGRKAYFCNFL
jgi:hypothetical protein